MGRCAALFDQRTHHAWRRWRGLSRRRRAVSQTAAWFGATYASTRALRYLQLNDRVPGGEGLKVKGEQIHHYVWGLLLLGFQGIVEAVFALPVDDPRRAAPYGAGLALALDEFDILLNARDWYWARGGRRWLDAAVLAMTATVAGIASSPMLEPSDTAPTHPTIPLP